MNAPQKTNRGWRIARRLLISVAVIVTLIALFYTEEDWRGKRAWENCKRELQAQGFVLDWDKFVPDPVPNDQNFFTASTNILLTFKQIPADDTNEIEAAHQLQWLKLNPLNSNGVPLFPVFDTSASGPIVVAKIIVSSRGSGLDPGSNTLAVSFEDPSAPARVQRLIQATAGRTISGAQGFDFSQFQFANLQPAQIFMHAGDLPSLAEMAAFIPSDTIGERGHLRIAATVDPKIYQVQLTHIRITSAADYLAWSDQFLPAFNEIREALRRPYAIPPGDYSQPFRAPSVNFVTMRVLAQTLAQRAQCYLLLGKPSEALDELTLVHNSCRILERPPTGKSETLVEAMINLAITDLYIALVQEGLQGREWKEPQLIEFQRQLQEINLPAFLDEALREEPARISRAAQTAPPPAWFSPKFFPWSIPRGWVYQMMAVSTKMECESMIKLGMESNSISPRKLNTVMNKIQSALDRHRHSPFYILARITMPNFEKAWQTTICNQTLANEANIACALERYHLAHGAYPESLAGLAPQFIETVPHDIITGQPLHYRRAADGSFLLYSVGWNEADDGGRIARLRNGSFDLTKGDWVWLGSTR